MNLYVATIFAAVFVSLCGAESLQCYKCDHESDKDCKGEAPDTASLAYIHDPDMDECKYCYKWSVDGGKKGERGCWNKDEYNTMKEMYGVSKGKCKKNLVVQNYDDATLCICEENKCNGSDALSFSVAMVIMIVAAKLMF